MVISRGWGVVGSGMGSMQAIMNRTFPFVHYPFVHSEKTDPNTGFRKGARGRANF